MTIITGDTDCNRSSPLCRAFCPGTERNEKFGYCGPESTWHRQRRQSGWKLGTVGPGL